MAEGTCSVEGCDRKPLAKGLCKAHYERNRRNGTPGGAIGRARVIRPQRSCTVEGCERPHKTHGYCAMHYQRWRKWGDPLVCKPPALFGTDHPGWKAEDVGYLGAHHRVERARGRADEHRCINCGDQAAQWAYDHDDPNELIGSHGRTAGLAYSVDPSHYDPMCALCHVRFDHNHRRATATS